MEIISDERQFSRFEIKLISALHIPSIMHTTLDYIYRSKYEQFPFTSYTNYVGYITYRLHTSYTPYDSYLIASSVYLTIVYLYHTMTDLEARQWIESLIISWQNQEIGNDVLLELY